MRARARARARVRSRVRVRHLERAAHLVERRAAAQLDALACELRHDALNLVSRLGELARARVDARLARRGGLGGERELGLVPRKLLLRGEGEGEGEGTGTG